MGRKYNGKCRDIFVTIFVSIFWIVFYRNVAQGSEIKISAIILNFRVVAIPRLLLHYVVAICANTRKLRIGTDILILKVMDTFRYF